MENIFAAFVCINNYLPMLIKGKPGCSKTLSVRILSENMQAQESANEYLRKFPKLRAMTFQGSELCTSQSVLNQF